LRADDDVIGAPPVVVLSHPAWQHLQPSSNEAAGSYRQRQYLAVSPRRVLPALEEFAAWLRHSVSLRTYFVM
jgi:hypothetical protein